MAKKKTETVAEEVVVEEAVIEEDAPVQETKAPEPVMYVGPTIPGIGIQNRVYTEIPAGAQEAFKEVPELRNLFLPIPQYPKAEQMIRERKGFVHSAYTKALTLKGGNKA